MNNWKPITKDSPTEEGMRNGIRVGMHSPKDWTESQWTYTANEPEEYRPHALGWQYWQPIIPPPRPDPAKEAFEKWYKNHRDQSLPSPTAWLKAAWHAALAWKEAAEDDRGCGAAIHRKGEGEG